MAAVVGDPDDGDDFGDAHDINVTPLIDVMLVLLILFMIAAPLSTVELPVDLPTSTAVPQKKPDKPTHVTIKSDLAVAIGETLYNPGHLPPVLFVVAGIIAIGLHAGRVRLAFMSQQPDSEPDLGAPPIEIGIELAVPKIDPTDLPVGPDTDAAGRRLRWSSRRP